MKKIDLLMEWSRGKRAPPFIIDISPTDYCNLHCLSCWQRNPQFPKLDSKKYELPDNRLLELVDEAKELGVQEWEITGGGEPLMRKITFDLLQKIRKNGMNGNITTNGIMITDKWAKELVKTGWNKITFSIDGPDAKTNDYLRGKKGSFEHALKCIKRIESYKKKLDKKKPIIAFNTVISNKNHNKLDKIIDLAQKNGVSIVNFEPITIHSKLGQQLKPDNQEIMDMQKQIEKAEVLSKRYNIHTNISNFKETELVTSKNKMGSVILKKTNKKKNLADAICLEPWYHLVIKVDGETGPCCIFSEKKMNVKDKSLKEIWYSNYFNNLRKSILS